MSYPRLRSSTSIGGIIQALRAAVVFGVALSASAYAAVPEYEAKTALLYKLSKFVRWPDDGTGSRSGVFTICVFGQDELATSIDELSGKALQGQRIAVDHFRWPDVGSRPCRIAVIGASERERLELILPYMAEWHALTVSNMAGFTRAGGVVALGLENGKLHIEINTRAARRAGLEVGSQLLQLVTIVGGT